MDGRVDGRVDGWRGAPLRKAQGGRGEPKTYDNRDRRGMPIALPHTHLRHPTQTTTTPSHIIPHMKHNYYTLKQRARKMRNNPTDAERILWYRLRKRRLNRYPFLRQRIIDGMIVDFLCRKTKLVIEVDGGQHDQRKQSDTTRTERLNRAGYQVLRFWNNDVIFNTESVLHTIDQTLKELETQQPSQPPRRQHKTQKHANPR